MFTNPLLSQSPLWSEAEVGEDTSLPVLTLAATFKGAHIQGLRQEHPLPRGQRSGDQHEGGKGPQWQPSRPLGRASW